MTISENVKAILLALAQCGFLVESARKLAADGAWDDCLNHLNDIADKLALAHVEVHHCWSGIQLAQHASASDHDDALRDVAGALTSALLAKHACSQLSLGEVTTDSKAPTTLGAQLSICGTKITVAQSYALPLMEIDPRAQATEYREYEL